MQVTRVNGLGMENGTIKQLQPLLPGKDETVTLVLELSDNLDLYNTYTELKLSFPAAAAAAAITEAADSTVGPAHEDDLSAQALAREAEVDDQLASQGIELGVEEAAPPPQWAHEVAVNGKQEVRDWAVRWLSTNGAFGAEDTGKFVVRTHDAAAGKYNLCLVYGNSDIIIYFGPFLPHASAPSQPAHAM